jgi:hypothetical protein
MHTRAASAPHVRATDTRLLVSLGGQAGCAQDASVPACLPLGTDAHVHLVPPPFATPQTKWEETDNSEKPAAIVSELSRSRDCLFPERQEGRGQHPL